MRKQILSAGEKVRRRVSAWRLPLVAVVVLHCAAVTAIAAPIPLYHNTLDDEASATALGGVLRQNPAPGAFNPNPPPDPPVPALPPSFVPGAVGNKFRTADRTTGIDNDRASTAAWLTWGSAEVQSIFGTNAAPIYKDADGITIDLYFSGIGAGQPPTGQTPNTDIGLWGVGHRGADNFILLGVQNNALRLNLRNDNSPPGQQATSTTFNWVTANNLLIAAQTYRVTVRQHKDLNGGFPEIYLDDLDDSISNVYDGPTLVPWTISGGTLPANYQFNFPLENSSGGSPPQALAMTIGSRYPVHLPAGQPVANGNSEIYNGMAIDDVKIYNGAYTPAQIDYVVPEPSSLCLLALGLLVPSLARRQR